MQALTSAVPGHALCEHATIAMLLMYSVAASLATICDNITCCATVVQIFQCGSLSVLPTAIFAMRVHAGRGRLSSRAPRARVLKVRQIVDTYMCSTALSQSAAGHATLNAGAATTRLWGTARWVLQVRTLSNYLRQQLKITILVGLWVSTRSLCSGGAVCRPPTVLQPIVRCVRNSRFLHLC